jgi:hypothetical protein
MPCKYRDKLKVQYFIYHRGCYNHPAENKKAEAVSKVENCREVKKGGKKAASEFQCFFLTAPYRLIVQKRLLRRLQLSCIIIFL